VSIKIIKLILLIVNLPSNGLERGIKDMGAKTKTLFYVFNKVLALQMTVCHFGMFKYSCIPFWFILE
jgi:hypothetical protein